MSTLRDITLVPAAVRSSATFGEAARELSESRAAAIAVLGEGDVVVGLFAEEDLLRGLCPPYLGELRHTAFLQDDPAALSERAAAVRDEPVARHMRRPAIVQIDTSATHAVELFLHHEEGALAVVEEGRFMGMLTRSDVCAAMARRLADA